MNNLELLINTISDSFTSFLPFAFVPITLSIMFSAIIHFRDFCCRSCDREIHDLKDEVKKCKDTVDELNKKYPPISPCDFHKNCLDCRLYNTGFCWKFIKE